MDSTSILLLAAVVMNATLSALIVARAPNSRENRWYALLCACMALWAISQYLLITRATDARQAYGFFAAGTVSWALVIPCYLMFVRHHAGPFGLLKTLIIPLIFFVNAGILAVGIWEPGWLIEKMVPGEAGSFVHQSGTGYRTLGTAHVVGGILICVVHMAMYLQRCARGAAARQARLILVVTVMPLAVGVAVQFLSYERLPDGPDLVVAITALNTFTVGIGILRYRLFSVDLDDTARTLVETLSEGLMLCDETGRIRFVNPAASTLLDLDPSKLLGRDLRDVLQPEDEVRRAIHLANRGRPVHGEGQINRRDGITVPVEYTINAVVRDLDRVIQGFVCAIRDVGPLKSLIHQLEEATRRLEEQAITDPLTGSYNRRYLEARLEEEFHASKRYKRPFSVIMLDLDHFKTVNDELGHDVGDDLLQMVANTLIEQVRTSDIVTRYGGDEFMVIMPETSDIEALAVVERLRQELSGGIQLQDVKVTASFGVVTYTGESAVESAADLMRQVDQAMLLSKRKGRDCVEVVDMEQGSAPEVSRPFRTSQGPDDQGRPHKDEIPEASRSLARRRLKANQEGQALSVGNGGADQTLPAEGIRLERGGQKVRT